MGRSAKKEKMKEWTTNRLQTMAKNKASRRKNSESDQKPDNEDEVEMDVDLTTTKADLKDLGRQFYE